jgi:predicted nucleotidyltransferase
LPLMPSSLIVPITSPHYIRFPMEDSGRRVTVHIATFWLKERAERDGKSAADLRLLCSLYRDEIEAAASVKYDRFQYHGADVVVVSSDLK